MTVLSFNRVQRRVALGAAVAVVASLGVATPSALAATRGDVVINEIMYDPVSGLDSDEFLEIANTTSSAIDVSGWCYSGVTVCLAAGTSIAPRGFLVVAPDATRFRSLYGFNPAATYTGKLSNGGETLAIKDAAGVEIDSVTYSDTPPWPVTPDGLGTSLELRDPSLDHNDPLNWAASTATRGDTAGAANSTVRSGFSPRITDMVASPAVPAPGQSVTVSVNVTGQTSAPTLRYRLDFDAEQTKTLTASGGGVFTATIPGVAAGHLMRYRVVAANGSGTSTLPRVDDTIGYEGAVATSAVQSAIPVLEWFLPDADYQNITSHPTVDIIKPSVLAYGGKVYDNTLVNIRGAISQTSPKPNWKFELPAGHPLDMPGQLVEPVDEFAMNGDWSDHSRGRPLLGWDAYSRAGVVNEQIFPVRAQRNAKFQGLYSYVDLFDGTWRDREGYGDKELYKASHDVFDESRPLNDYRMEKKNPKDGNYAPVRSFIDGIEMSGNAQRDFVLANVDIPQMLNYAAVTAIIQSSDASTKNWYNSLDPKTGRWSTIPWDLDKTWGNTCCGINSTYVTPSEPGDTPNKLMAAVLSQPEWRAMYFRRLKTLVGDVLSPGRLEAVYDAKIGPAQPEFALDLTAFPTSTGSYANQRTRLFNAIASRRSVFASDPRVPAAQSADPNVVISEIQHSPTGGGDAEFLELYNPSPTEAVDLSGWTISDGVNLTVQPGTVILPKGTMTFAANDPTFRATYGSKVFVGGRYGGGLSAGETLTLKRSNGSTADAVTYGGAGWPLSVDGRSLELNDTSADHNVGSNWRLSTGGGTPGVANFTGSGSNQAPVAAFTSVVSGSAVTFDGSGSTDPDGSVASYAWDFGDGTSGTGSSPSHTYASAGTYQVRLTVTDNLGATGTVAHPVVVATTPPTGSLGFVAATHSNDGASRFKSVAVPSGVKAGDTMLVFLTRASSVAWTGPTGVAGLGQLDSFDAGTLTSTVWSKTLTATDVGKTVRVDAPKYSKAELSAAVYTGVNVAGLTASAVAHTSDARTASHASATLSVPAGSWAVTYWADKSAGTTAWTAPAGVTSRDVSLGSGGGRYGSLLVDSGGALPAGTYGPKTATTNAASYDTASFTIALAPSGGGTANRPPVGGFTSVVTGSSVTFDGSGSTDPDGSVASYEWAFGDGTTGSGVAPSHTYTAAGTYQARLTVTDNQGATGTVTHPVTIVSTPPAGSVGFVGAAHSDDGASRFKAVTVPTGAKAGDALVVFLTRASSVGWTGPTGVAGLGQLDSFDAGSLTSTVWSKTLTAADLGNTVRVDAPKYSKAELSVAVYTGVNGAALGATSVAHTSDTRSATHASAALSVPAGAWAVTYWADKSAGTTTWTAPAGVMTRDVSFGSGGGRYGSLLVDSGGPLPAGTYGPKTATTNAAGYDTASFTIALTPAG